MTTATNNETHPELAAAEAKVNTLAAIQQYLTRQYDEKLALWLAAGGTAEKFAEWFSDEAVGQLCDMGGVGTPIND